MKAAHRALLFPVLLAAVAALAGCGYQAGSLHPTDVTSIDVPIWTVGRNVYRRELESRLTEAIKKRISLDTPYKIATSNTADTRLTGTIESVDQRVLSTDPDTGFPREKEVTLTVSFRWMDLRTGKERLNVPSFRCSSTYITHEPFTEDFFLGSEDAIDRLAKRIVEQLESDW